MNYYGENSNEYPVPLNRGEITSHLKWLYEKYNRLRFYASLDDEELAEMRHATRDDMKSKAELRYSQICGVTNMLDALCGISIYEEANLEEPENDKCLYQVSEIEIHWNMYPEESPEYVNIRVFSRERPPECRTPL